MGAPTQPPAASGPPSGPPPGPPEGPLDSPPDGPPHRRPARPRAAATIVLLRSGGPEGIEVLLVRRGAGTAFVPGAYVFPGGRVDAEDSDPALLTRLRGLDQEGAARRLGLDAEASPPAIAYYMAAVREAFEETGLIVAHTEAGAAAPTVADEPELERARGALLDSTMRLSAVLERHALTVSGDRIEYIAHWITPVTEPRRYDTRFFAAVVPAGARERINPKEMTDSIWVGPDEALRRNRADELAMVVPTIHTLRQLLGFSAPEEVLRHFAAHDVPTIQPGSAPTPTDATLDVRDRDEGP